MTAEDIKAIVKDHLIRKGCPIKFINKILMSYAEAIYEDFENGETCEEIAEAIYRPV